MRYLQLEQIIRLSGGPEKFMLRVFAEDKSTARSHQRMAWVGTSDANVLRQLADALDHYGSWEAVQDAYTEALVEAHHS